MVDDENIDKFSKTDGKGEMPEEIFSFLDEVGFFNINNKVGGQAYLHVTNQCNMNCKGCYSAIDNRNSKKDLSLEQIKTILRVLAKHNIIQIIISGGEPTVRKDLQEILQYAKENCGFRIVMISNGSTIIENNIFKYLDTIAFSIDDLEKEYNTLHRKINKDLLIKNIQNARLNGVESGGIITINNKNVDNIDSYFELSHKYKLPISFSIFYSKDEGCEELLVEDHNLTKLIGKCCMMMDKVVEGFNPIDEIYCKSHCDAGNGNISVDAEGNLTPCHMMPNYKLGNILTEAEKVWEELNKFCIDLKQNNSECLSCEYKIFCGGGCRARAYEYKGLNAKDPYCKMYKDYYDMQYKVITEVISL